MEKKQTECIGLSKCGGPCDISCPVIREKVEELSTKNSSPTLILEQLESCHDCGAKPGQHHSDNCDVERCSVCGGQRIQCNCDGHDKSFAKWTGIWPGKAEATYLGLCLNDFQSLGYSKIFYIKDPRVNEHTVDKNS